MKVIYIAGYGRSGSTLLERVLAIGPGIASSGEAASFPKDVLAESPECSCGLGVYACPQWSKCIQAIEGSESLLDLRPGALSRFENGIGLLRILGLSSARSREAYTQYQQMFFTSLVEANGKDTKFICDSSKTSLKAAFRPWALRKLAALDVYVIHLVRDGRACLWSNLRGSNRFLEQGKPLRRRFTGIRTSISWALANWTGEQSRRMLGEKRYIRVKYEDFVLDPAGELSRLETFLGLSLLEQKDAIAYEAEIPLAHQLSGNRMRGVKRIRLRLDDEWKQHLPRSWRWLFTALNWPWLLRYGYLRRTRYRGN